MSEGPDPRLIRAVRQNAATIGLLGVDFVPVRSAAAGSEAPAQVESKPLSKPAPSAAAAKVVVVASTPSTKPLVSAAAGGVRDRQRSQALLDSLRERYEREAPHKKFVTAHHNIVFGEGDPCARLMFVGEAPGAEEDRVGRPFVGRSGQLLDKMITAMGLSREQVYIANVLKTRPPDNATPTSDECAACAPFLHEQILIVRPEALVTLGLPASRTLLNSVESMTNLRGRWHAFQPSAALAGTAAALGLEPGWNVPVMPTYHPAFLLRSYTPENRAKVWSDLQQVIDRLGLKGQKQGAEAVDG
jgi:DNA polymerase